MVWFDLSFFTTTTHHHHDFGLTLLLVLTLTQAIHKRLLAKKKIITRSSGPSGSALDLVRKEIRILNALPPHPNVARLFEVIDDPNCEKLYLCLEYAGKPLNGNHQHVRMQKQLVGVLGQVARGLEFLHGHGVIHGDLKVEHLLVETETEKEKAGSSSFPWTVKIVDFGSSETFEEENDLLTRSPGTPVYTHCVRVLHGQPLQRRTQGGHLGPWNRHVSIEVRHFPV